MRRVAITLCVFFCLNHISAQNDPLKKANEAFDNDAYREAIIYLNRVEKLHSSGPLLFKRGICNFEINQLEQATADFQRAWELGYENEQVDFYNGRIQHHQGNFGLAAKYYKNYLNEISEEDVAYRQVVQLIKQCGRAIDLSYQRPLAIIEQLKRGINTAYDDIGLLESPSIEGKYYYSSNHPNLSSSMSASDYDVYSITYDQGSWSDSKRMRYNINKRDQEVLLGFTSSADGLYFYRGKDHNGAIYVNRGTGNQTRTRTVELPSFLTITNSDCFIFDDHVAVFASKDFQGYGGYDLYVSILTEGKWSEPQNLGPEINSKYDELHPFFTPDGSELYFSSNNLESIGGFDVFYSTFLFESNKWSNPINLGIPINSPGDDTHFELAQSGLTGSISSNRKNAVGGFDNYIVRFKEARGQQLLESGELAFIDYKMQESPQLYDENFEISLSDSLEQETVDISQANDLTQFTTLKVAPLYYKSGIDLINPDNIEQLEEVTTLLQSKPSITLELAAHSIDEAILEYKLYSSVKIAERLKKYFVQNGIDERRIHVTGFGDNYPIAVPEKDGGDYKIAQNTNQRIEFHFDNYNIQELNISRVEPEIPDFARGKKYDLYSTLIEDAITFKIQIAVVSQMYRGMALDLFNDASVEKDLNTGLYNYTIGLYDNYIQASTVKRDMDRLGITDAKLVAYYNGKRLTEDQYVYYVNDFPELRNLMNFQE